MVCQTCSLRSVVYRGHPRIRRECSFTKMTWWGTDGRFERISPVLANGAVRRGLPPQSKLLLSSDRRAILLWSKRTTFALWRKDSSSASVHQLQSKQTLKPPFFLQQQVASFVLREVAHLIKLRKPRLLCEV
jgi:hypothetical protein